MERRAVPQLGANSPDTAALASSRAASHANHLRRSVRLQSLKRRLSTTEEFGSVPLGNIGKHLSQHEVQAAIRELGRVIDEDRPSSEEGSPPPQTLLEGR